MKLVCTACGYGLGNSLTNMKFWCLRYFKWILIVVLEGGFVLCKEAKGMDSGFLD